MKSPDAFRKFCSSFQRDSFEYGSTFEDVTKAAFACLTLAEQAQIRTYFDYMLSDKCSGSDVIGMWRRGRPEEGLGRTKDAKNVLHRMRAIMGE